MYALTLYLSQDNVERSMEETGLDNILVTEKKTDLS